MKTSTVIQLSLLSFLVLCFANATAKTDNYKGDEEKLNSVVDNKNGNSLFVIEGLGIIKNCRKKFNASRVSYWIVKSEESIIPLQTYDQIDATQPVIYILHGWLGNKDVDYVRVIWQAYQRVGKTNVIILDYGFYANGSYLDAVCYAPYVAQDVGSHICELGQSGSISPEDVHLVSHSLGSQISGLAGQYVKEHRCGTIGRITALDPAGPTFQALPRNKRLDKGDALFVDVIHTSMGQYGYVGSVGHIDFYPNCGVLQPGCPKDPTGSGEFQSLALDYVVCNHVRSCYLFAESIERDAFRATSCPLCGDFICLENVLAPDYTYMGENCTKPGKFRAYYVSTRKSSPFGKGPEA